VVTPDGRRHVFHHIASGAYAGAATHLSRFFVHHPMTFMDERDRLEAEGACVRVTADPRGYVTTPWDMMVNHALEASRGGARHGSCGYGFGETVGRNEETGFGLTLADLASDDLVRRLVDIRDLWLPARLRTLGVAPDAETLAAMRDRRILERFVADCAAFLSVVRIVDDADLGSLGRIVFEAAQGLMLDQRGRDFPHVTRSNTGIQNMAAIAAEAGIGRIDATYATRCYLTRHGAGPMPDHRDLSDLFEIVDETNVPNPWQSSIRHGLLDLDVLSDAIREDVAKADGIEVRTRLAVSCLDQSRDGTIRFIRGGVEERAASAAFAMVAAREVGASGCDAWFSPGRTDAAIAA
jgi:adenylosuccinate synthase